MIIEKILTEDIIKIVRFPDIKKELIDIDIIFKTTNQNYSKLLLNLGLEVSFDLTKRDNKKLYTHTFLKTFMDFIDGNNNEYKLFFFSDISTKDKIRNILVNKIKKYFGFLIFEDNIDLSTFINKIENNDGNYTPKFEIFLNSEKKPKQFKFIKKYLDKEGLEFMSNNYFENFCNKMMIYV
jgi:hypothetical protein